MSVLTTATTTNKHLNGVSYGMKNITWYDINKANSLMTLKEYFPELTDKQFHVCASYSLGINIHIISSINNRSIEATKKLLLRSRNSLNINSIEDIRGVFIMRLFWRLL